MFERQQYQMPSNATPILSWLDCTADEHIYLYDRVMTMHFKLQRTMASIFLVDLPKRMEL